MNIELICPYSFPIGLSATNRIISYTKGLVENGDKVKVLIVRPTESKNDIENANTMGTYFGVEYQYTWSNNIWPAAYYKKLVVFILSIAYSFFVIIKDNSRNKIDCLISSYDSGIVNFALFFLVKLIGCKIIYIADEYPYPLRYGRAPSFIRKISINYTNRLFDGMIVMTRALNDYFKDKVRKEAKFLLMPMTVEPERFICNNTKPLIEGDYIAYAGDLSRNKDGVINLIKSFKIISGDYPDLQLCIVGYTKSKSDFDNFEKVIINYNLVERIIMTGKIDRDLVPIYLNHAVALAIAEPNSYRAIGCFPTKLGEYLSSGRPVVCTALGEIPEYLSDCVNAFLVEPDDNNKFADKLRYVLENKKLAENIGKEGQRVALSVFNYKVQSKRMHDFILGL